MVEQWKDIAGYEGWYQVSNLGNVRSLDRHVSYSDGREYDYPGRTLVPLYRGKYKGVTLAKNSKVKQFDIHRLVASAFCSGTGEVVNHIDRDTQNNTWTNLEWCSTRTNVRHSVAIVKPRDVAFIRCIRWKMLPIVAKQMGISKATAYNIYRGMNWPEITPRRQW